MTSEFRKRIPAGRILVPTLCACVASVGIASVADSVVLGILAAVPATLLSAYAAERGLRRIVDAMSLIAGGDRYAALPDTF
jgi:hypothetical protein